MIRSNRITLAIASGTAFLAVIVWITHRSNGGFVVADVQTSLVAVGCVMLYLGSHVLRASRLAIIGLNIHRTSFRTLALLHLSVAPWSIIAPFKLDEVIRIIELRSINGSLARGIITVIIDRSLDGPVLLAITLYLALHGEYEIAFYTGVIGFALVAITIGFFAALHILQLVQRHVFLYHYKARALHVLKIVHHLRTLAKLGRETILNTAPILILCTIGIWFCEISAVGLLLQVLAPAHSEPSLVISATLVRANSGWRALLLGDRLGFPAALITNLFAAGLFLIWPAAIWLYCKRRLSEMTQAQFLSREWSAATGPRRRA